MESYEQLLNNAYKNLKVVSSSGERFEIPKVTGQVSGKNTIITNMGSIASYIRRPIEHIAKFLMKELATPGEVEKDRLILKTKMNSSRVNEKIELYVREFVLCPECKKPDTEIITERGVKFKHCLACNAKNPIKSKI
jgi:translation initiation factor 2 subunit 2